MRWKRYPAYKDSGAEWLDAIPASWEVKPLKRVASLNDDSLPDNTDGQFRMLYVDISSVDEGQSILRKHELAFEDAPSRARRLVRHGDVIISTVRTYLRAIAPVVNPEDNLVVSTGFAVVRPVDDKLEPSFAAYALRSDPFIESIMRFSAGVSYPAINPSALGDLPLVLPSRGEQHRIATFLDHRTGYIDTLISKKQRQVQLLDEKRIALITHAVTKGLDPNVKMKDSGVVWLGKVPEHWAVTCLGRFARVKSGEFISNQETSGEKQPPHVYPVIGGNGIMGYCADYNEKCPLIVIGRVGAHCGNVHLLDERVWVTDNALILHDVRGFRLEYLTCFLQVAQLNQYASQTAQPLITGSMLKAHSVVLPPLEEQRSIVSFLERHTARIDALRDKIQQSIETLQEYRSALISAAVTGQIDVREEVV